MSDGISDRLMRQRVVEAVALAAMSLGFVAFMFADLGSRPLMMWDESRQAVNAAEMVVTGNRLVTSYGFVPDLWNTKPPLLVNLMALALQVFGYNTFALRLVPALSGCLTVALVGCWTGRVTRSIAAGIAAAALLATSSGFYGVHAASSGDFDAPLMLLVTAYSALLWRWLESCGTEASTAVLIGLLIGLAVLDKGIAGVVPLAGMGIYALAFSRQRLAAGAAGIVTIAVVAAAVSGGYYLYRAWDHPDFLAIIASNEVGGRFGVPQDGFDGPWWYYLAALFYPADNLWPLFSAGATGVAVCGWAWLLPPPQRRVAGFVLCAATGIIAVYSSAATKQFWYIAPALPFLSIAAGLGGVGAVAAVRRRLPEVCWVVPAVFLVALVSLGADAVIARYVVPSRGLAPRAFGTLAAAASARRLLPLAVYDRGYYNRAGFSDYAANLRFYELAAAAHGEKLYQVTTRAAAVEARFIGSCDAATRNIVAGLGRLGWAGAGCLIVDRGR